MPFAQISPSPLTASLLIAFVCGVLADTASAIDIYKWVDENGVTHYSNEKPAGVKWKIMPEARLSVIPGERIGAEAARAARNERAATQSATTSPSDGEKAFQERRDRLLRDCHINNGVDCEREVDTQLRAERIQQDTPVVDLAPPPPASGSR
jgi:hypothetical protein